MLRPIAALAVLTLAACPLHAQTIYAPVQYQYGEGVHKYYYGGSDPAVLAVAERQRRVDQLTDVHYGTDRYNAAYMHYRLIGRLERVYSDAVPFVNARVYGYQAVDAANDAYANVPTYFRKADLLRAATVMTDGSRIVAAQARPVNDPDDARGATTRSAIRPRAIIIIPRGKAKTSDKQLTVTAR